MSHITNTTEFAKAFQELKDAIPPIIKSSINPHFKNRYASLDMVIDAVNVAIKATDWTVLEMMEVKELAGCIVQVHHLMLFHESGSITSEYLVGEVDKPQAMGSSLTYARRYHYPIVFGVVSEDDDDAQAAQTAAKQPLSVGSNTVAMKRKLA